MVIHQFNKLIRNKWIWGAFAVAVSAFFCFDESIIDLLGDRATRERGGAGTLGGEGVSDADFRVIADDLRGQGRMRDNKTPDSEINLRAWKTIAALRVAKANGIEATRVELQDIIRNERAFQENGAFSYRAYQMWLRQVGETSEARFEQRLERDVTLGHATRGVLEAATWVSPMELDRAIADMTDVFTVKVAKFTQTKEEADAIKLDDAGLLKWYNENTNSIALPERVKIRYVKYAGDDAKTMAKMVVTDDQLHDYYDANSENWTTTDTNGVEQVKEFEAVKAEVESAVRKIAALEFYETNLTTRVYGIAAKEGASRLDEIAKEDGQKIAVSDYFTVDGAFVEGFMKRAEEMFPGADGFVDAVAQLDPEVEDLRYGVVIGGDSVWLIERAEVSKAHVPTFAEAKEIITPKALEAAKADAFKAKVEAIAKKGVAEVEKTPGISTNYTFSVSEMKPGMFVNQRQVAMAVTKLAKGEVSEFTPTGKDSAVLVICVDRKDGDATQAALLKSQLREQLASYQRRALPEAWLDWNLDRLGYEAESSASTMPEENTDAE